MTNIDRRWLPLNALRAFEAVGRAQSFTAAAQTLCVSQSAVSRHVIALEGLLGTQLFDRKPQGLGLTDAGAALLPVVRKSFDRIEQMLNDILREGGARARVLRVQFPPTFAHKLAVPILSEFRADCPDIILDIESMAPAGPPARDTDAAVIYAKPHADEQVASLLWMEKLVPLCHPSVAMRLQGSTPAAFLSETELLHVRLEGEPRYVLWHMLSRELGISIAVERGLVFDTSILAAQYALSGAGIALLDREVFASDIAAGRLVAPFDATLEGGYGYYLTVLAEDLEDRAIAEFRSWMIRRFAISNVERPKLRAIAGRRARAAPG